MNIIRTLGFAAIGALSLGVGAAMAQVDGVDAGAAGTPANSTMQAPAVRSAPAAVQSGSSDVTPSATLLPGNYYDIGSGGASGG